MASLHNNMGDDGDVVIAGCGPEETTMLCVLLHGFQCRARDLIPLCRRLAATVPGLRVWAPQAPERAITAHGGLKASAWFDYLTDRAGVREDEICARSLRQARQRLLAAAAAELERCDLLPERGLVFAGISQGGCMAWDLSTRSPCRGVLTAVAHPLYASRHRRPSAPWRALVARQDSIFQASWAGELLESAGTLETTEGDHWVSDRVLRDFFGRHLVDWAPSAHEAPSKKRRQVLQREGSATRA